MKRHVLILFAAVIFTLTLASCTSKYDAEDFIGKTSAEIVDENGDFDCVIGEADDGIYSNCKCGYTIKEKKAGFLGSSDEVLFFICFDENGVAMSCDEGVRPGGQGHSKVIPAFGFGSQGRGIFLIKHTVFGGLRSQEIDKSKLGDTEFDNLLFLWYDEENDNFVELDTILDEENSTVSVETTHFSKYMIVDGKEWYRAWQDIYTKINESKGQHIPNATVLISKSSNIYNVNNANRNELIVSNIVDSMSDSDIMSFLTYQNAGGMNTDFTSVKSALKWDPIYYSRTANASYGIGLAAVILNDEVMGYNSKIIFITDSSVSVDSRFLKLAINNKIPIYFFCIGDFNTAALIGYAQLTGGKVYSAKTAAEINQSCNEIGPKTFVGETDTDGDGFTDIEEMSGLIVSSNCKIVNTDYMKADTDDDGLDDNEEVDVELTKVEIPGKL